MTTTCLCACVAAGTFYSPFFLDTSDVLIQAVPLLQDLTTFIDMAWVRFVASFNRRARILSRDCVERTAGALCNPNPCTHGCLAWLCQSVVTLPHD